MAWVSFYKANATAYSLAVIHHHPFPFDTHRRWTRDLSNSGYPSLTTATPFNARALGSNLLLQNLFVDIRGERVTRVVATTKQGRETSEPFRFQDFKERAEELGHSSLVKQAAKYAEEMGLQLQLEYPNPTCTKHDSVEVITGEKLKAELRRCLQQKTWERWRDRTSRGTLTSIAVSGG